MTRCACGRPLHAGSARGDLRARCLICETALLFARVRLPPNTARGQRRFFGRETEDEPGLASSVG